MLRCGIAAGVAVFIVEFGPPTTVVTKIFLGVLVLGICGAMVWCRRPYVVAARDTSLDKAWKEFVERPGASADHFTIDSVLSSRSLGTLPNALPGVFTAVGLLGTFVGIAMGLADLPQDWGESEELRDSISTLMGGMSTAFITSIVGITWSVWWLFDFRIAERKLTNALKRFLDKADRDQPTEDPHDTLIRVANATEGFKASINQLGYDIATALEKKVAEPIQHLKGELGKHQTEALKKMVDEFRATLVASVQEELGALGKSLREASDHQAKAASRLESFFDRLAEVSEMQTGLLNRTVDAAAVFDKGLRSMTAAAQAVEAAGASARATMSAAREAADAAKLLGQEGLRQLEFQERASAEMRRSWASLLENTKTDFRRLAKELAEKTTEFHTASAQRISEVFHVFDSEMSKVVRHLGGTLAELREVTQGLPEALGGLRETAGHIAKAGQDQRASLAQDLAAFDSARRDFVEIFEHGRKEARRLSAKLPRLAEEIGRQQAELAAAMQETRSSVADLAAKMEATEGRAVLHVEGVMKATESAATRVEVAARSLAEAVSSAEGGTTAAAERLAALHETATDVSSTVRNAVQGLPEALDSVRETGPGVIKAAEAQGAALMRVVNALEELKGEVVSGQENTRQEIRKLVGSRSRSSGGRATATAGTTGDRLRQTARSSHVPVGRPDTAVKGADAAAKSRDQPTQASEESSADPSQPGRLKRIFGIFGSRRR